jgi:hypothetical protein
MKMEQSVPKRWLLKSTRRGTAQKKMYGSNNARVIAVIIVSVEYPSMKGCILYSFITFYYYYYKNSALNQKRQNLNGIKNFHFFTLLNR